MEAGASALESVEGLKISVIMLTYNREDLVGRAIESILSQSFHDFEFIIVNNGSTDRSGAIADEYADRDTKVRVIHSERGNIGSGRNTGMDASVGEYITFIDDDDYAEHDYLEFLLRLVADNDAEAAICGAADRVFEEKLIMTAEQAIIELLWRKRYTMAFPTKLFHRNLVEDLRFSIEDKHDDIALMYKVLAKARCIAYHGLPKYTFYRHEGNNSAWTTNHKLLTSETLDEYLRAYRERTQWLSEKFPNSAAAFRYFEWSFMLSMMEKIIRLGIAGCSKQLGHISQKLKNNLDEFMTGGFILEKELRWIEEYLR